MWWRFCSLLCSRPSSMLLQLINCFFPRCLGVYVLLQLALSKLLFYSVAAASIVSFLAVDVLLHLALFEPLFCAFAPCIIFFLGIDLLLQLTLSKLLFCTFAVVWIVSFLGVDMLLHLALFQPLFCASTPCIAFCMDVLLLAARRLHTGLE